MISNIDGETQEDDDDDMGETESIDGNMEGANSEEGDKIDDGRDDDEDDNGEEFAEDLYAPVESPQVRSKDKNGQTEDLRQEAENVWQDAEDESSGAAGQGTGDGGQGGDRGDRGEMEPEDTHVFDKVSGTSNMIMHSQCGRRQLILIL